ncbi:MAG: hypothetical protein OEM60_14290 [Gammaproteobacteria bacterium]|nr:hypothetical protein [Gammaproteobacteria bacterium]MDH3430305.1 hypothetical protein [Gammaproteobacteria bacterium]MDH3435031.1 hypothetical protein [Gammaproteobacteria bacterium]
MNTFKSMAGVLLLALLSCGVANADDSEWGVGIKAGTLGLGLEARWSGLPYIDLRMGVNGYTYEDDGRQANVLYDAELDLETFFLTANFHFPLSPFRLTVGAFANGNEFNMVSSEPGDFNIGGDFYTGAEVGTLSSTTSFGSTSPYLGLGFDFELFGKAGLNFDVGVLWQDEPEVSLVATGLLADDPTFMASLENERLQLEDDMSDFKAYPVVSLSFVYNF